MQPERLLTKPFVLTMLAEFALCMSIGMLLAVVPVYAHDDLGVGSFGVALAVAAVSPMVLVCQPLAGRFGDRRGRKFLIVAGGAIAALAVAGYVVADCSRSS
jgi:MFS family permease